MEQLASCAEHPRSILHVNTDDFFASLARLRDTSLRGRPVVVGHLLNRGSVVSASYEARAAGVHPGLTMQQAARRLPGAALVQVDWAVARRASRELLTILESCSPRVEASCLDEAFVDYTGCERLLGPPLDAGRYVQRLVQERVGLEVSIGVAANKLVSRFASSSAKRHNLLDVLPGSEARFVAPQPVERLPGVGAVLGRKLRDMGVPTVGHLAAFPSELLETVFGAPGRRLAAAARGIDSSPVIPARPRATVEQTETFEPDLLRWDELEARLDALCTQLGEVLRRRRCTARQLTVELEHSDRLCLRRRTRLQSSNLDTALFAAARPILVALYVRRVRVRRLLLRAEGLEPAAVQLDLFRPDAEDRLRRLMQASDRVRARYGGAAVLLRGRALLGGSDGFAGSGRLG